MAISSRGKKVKSDNLDQHFPQHIYTPLSESSRDIRLLHLRPGIWSDPIQCTLETVSLNDGPRHRAISYVWGDPKAAETIYVNGKPFQATTNLVAALRHLRYIEELGPIWADAVCINQQSNDEKTNQVALMRDIYRDSHETLVWLGVWSADPLDTNEHDQDPFEVLRYFAQNKHFDEMPGFTKHAFRGFRFRRESAKSRAMWDGFQAIVNNVWWTRVWTLQEVIVPMSVRFCFGLWQMEIRDLFAAFENQITHANSCCSSPFDRALEFDTGLMTEFVSQLSSIIGFRMPVQDGSSDITRPFGELDVVCRNFNSRKCQDRRDKIYGFLGLVNSPNTIDFSPNYNVSHYEAYTQAMRALLEADGGNLRCLAGLGFGRSCHESGDLPSWTRDFSADFEQAMNDCDAGRINMQNVYHASGDRVASICFSGDGLELPVRGIRVGHVENLLRRPDQSGDIDHDTTQALRAWFDQVNKCENRCDLTNQAKISDLAIDRTRKFFGRHLHTTSDLVDPSKAYGQGTLSAAFWRTVTAGCMNQGALEGIFESAKLTDKDLKYLVSHGKKIWTAPGKWRFVAQKKYFHTIVTATTSRTMFRSDSHRLGLCYPNAEVGDEIWVLFGGRVPFLLRPHPQAHSEPPDGSSARVYRFVGECCYDGFMFGEGFSENGAIEEVVLR